MTELANVSLENELDLILAYKKSIQVASYLNLTIATQTAFATAVSEICREVIDKGFDGTATICVIYDGNRFSIASIVTFKIDDDFAPPIAGFEYARKLLPSFELRKEMGQGTVSVKLAIPRSAKIDKARVNQIKLRMEQEGPISPYEELKLKNEKLHSQNLQKDQELVNIKTLNDQRTEFLSIASHELNTPLTVLRMMAQIALKLDRKQDEALSGYLKKIELQSAKLVRLTQQLFDISKIEAGQFSYNKEEVPLDSYLIGIVESVVLLNVQHRINTDFQTSDDRVFIDKIKIEQVINNIINNAVKYSNPNTDISISSSKNDNMARICIRDTGIGMNKSTQEQIFDKFYRAESAYKHNGLGMGLYIASRIVSDHDGTITVESSPGKGSVFSVSIPLVR